ncbi:MAG TPA: right-handed parallel beta-helix repeat-containing protein [Candidatus Polarisedimenticolia bacterium]|nr:right-handed parallel beta-helix repeat-containing protein [Candidatus Polarisedimenticolia bacterium]
MAPNGNDANPGTENQPLASLAQAQRKAYAFRNNSAVKESGSIEIILRNGIYPLADPLQFSAKDSGGANQPLVIRAAPGETPVLSGAVKIRGWKPARQTPGLPAVARGKVWVAEIEKIDGRPLKFRQLWVDDSKAMRAREPNDDSLSRLVGWNKTNQVAAIPAAALAGITTPKQLEMVIDQVWEIAVLRVKSIQVQGTNALVTFRQPESNLEFEHPWPPVIVKPHYRAPFFLANAIQFLDSPGEWFEDVSAGKIYYWPRPGEDLSHAKVFAPVLETLVSIEGSLEKPVANIQFKGITFSHTTWLRPSEQGHVPLQAGMFMLDVKKLSPKGTPYHRGLDNLAWIGRPPAAVSVKNADDILFEDCIFEHFASAGLDFQSGAHDDSVAGCSFREIGGNGLQLGKFSDANVETHIPYQPSDERELCSHEKISNNIFTDCGDEDWGCVGIGIGYARNVSVEHNEVFNLPYTGISVGWGWTKATNCMSNNFIFANHIHHVGERLGDLGGIYTLSVQPGTVIAENSISDIQPSPFVPDPEHWYYLYLDEGSSFITVRDNWCPAEKFLKNANGPGNEWSNNGPQVSEKIKNAAGLEPDFQHLLRTNRSQKP